MFLVSYCCNDQLDLLCHICYALMVSMIYSFILALNIVLIISTRLCFRKDRTALDYILSEDAMIIPSKGILRACAIYLPVS